MTRLWILSFAVGVVIASPCFADAICTGEDLELKVCRLDPSYKKEATFGAEYEAPTCGSILPQERARIRTHVRNAFNIAPERVQNELCRLDRIFTADRNFGLWENPSSPSFMGTEKRSYVAIQESVIAHDPGTPKPNALSDVENTLVWGVLEHLVPGSAPNTWTSHAAVLTSGTDTTPLAVLSLLAHELGHVKWYRDNIDSSLACFDTAFTSRAWRRGSLTQFYRRRWTGFAADPQAEHNPTYGTRHPRDLRGRSDAVHLAQLHRGFATTFAAVAPDEDFVETYRILALKNAGSGGTSLLQSLTLTITPPAGPPINVNLLGEADERPSSKFDCVRPLVK